MFFFQLFVSENRLNYEEEEELLYYERGGIVALWDGLAVL
jgi:hypothetical protein